MSVLNYFRSTALLVSQIPASGLSESNLLWSNNPFVNSMFKSKMLVFGVDMTFKANSFLSGIAEYISCKHSASSV